MTEPNKVLTGVFISLTSRWSDTRGFLQVAALGVPHAEATLLRRHASWADEFFSNPENDQFFTDKAGFLAQSGGPAAMAQRLTIRTLGHFRGSVDAAAVVFMHAALDAATYDLCRVTAMVAPADWEPLVERQKVALGEMKTDSYDAILQRLIERQVNDFERRSLVEKADRLLALCRPTKEFVPVTGFAYDRERLIEMDRLRHDIVHRGSRPPVGAVHEILERLLNSGLHLLGLVSHRYGVQIDPTYAFNP
jgi:hypothetical protein